MIYSKWIQRERRIRLKILKNSPIINEQKIYRVCQNCNEICLCHEENCPNCNHNVILNESIKDIENEVYKGERIRCRYRFEHL